MADDIYVVDLLATGTTTGSDAEPVVPDDPGVGAQHLVAAVGAAGAGDGDAIAVGAALTGEINLGAAAVLLRIIGATHDLEPAAVEARLAGRVVRSGGEGARYLGIDISREYRVDQVTVNLRAVDVRTGQVLANVMTSKTIYSVGRSAGVIKFIEFKSP